MSVEFIVIFLFILLNGFFAGAEIAVVTARTSKIEALAKEGSKSAKKLLKLKNNADRFLATVQIGVTIAGAGASAIGGAAAIEKLEPLIRTLPIPYISEYISAYSGAIALAIVVVFLSYISLIFGELVPKTIALAAPERIAMAIAGPILSFSKVSSILVSLLTCTTNFILKPFGQTTFTNSSLITQEEIKLLVKEGKENGIFEETEQKLIHSVFEFTDIAVKDVMVPLGQATTISLEVPFEQVLWLISEEQYSRYPVYHKDKNNIKGVLYAKDIFNLMAKNKEVNIRKLLKAPFYVPDTMKISHLLKEMQKKHMHMAFAVDEHGMITGICTIEDLIEEIVGEIRDEHDVERPVIDIGNSTYIVYASIHLRDLKEDYNIDLPESEL
ncbi:MAG: hemolysin family protein [Candidatus Magnetoovum sp. WYHC-5]|nr:hemolysin family protein [Candidatus Magnetoovum sp. WYHC-5]